MKRPLLAALALIAAALAGAPYSPTEASFRIKGLEIYDLKVGGRNAAREAPLSMTVINTTAHDWPGMQVTFVAWDSAGKMGPFWLPGLGHESEWAVKAGETRTVTGMIRGFGTRDLSQIKVVDLKILGADVRKTAGLTEAERRRIFAAIVKCEDDANAEAATKYPTDMAAFKDHADPLIEACKAKVQADHNLSDKDKDLISREGVRMHWPPLGSN